MTLLDPTYIRDNCDYSFGDQSGSTFINGYMKPANLNNMEFMNKYNSLLGIKKYMTLFIDNIRLYKRDGIKYTAGELADINGRNYKDAVVREYFKTNDLLEVCSNLNQMKFVIFTGFEDTPIDEFIYDKIPDNVIRIYASNAISFGGKVIPIPYGIQRKLWSNDYRQDTLRQMIPVNRTPSNLLYMNHRSSNNPERYQIDTHLSGKNWVTHKDPSQDYATYLNDIKNHKFMICPSGNAIGCECHRDWEVLYMRRVPIVKRSEYLEYIFKDFPVLFVDDFSLVTEDLLIENEDIYQRALNLDLNKLDMEILYKEYLNQVESLV